MLKRFHDLAIIFPFPSYDGATSPALMICDARLRDQGTERRKLEENIILDGMRIAVNKCFFERMMREPPLT